MRLCQNSLDISCCFNSPILTGNELSWCLLWPFEWTVPLLCATPFAVPLTVPFVVVPFLFTVPFRCLRSPFFCKQTRFIYIHRYQSFRQENQSRLLHIFLDAPVCNEIRGNHMGIIHYAILSRNSSIGAIFTIYSRKKSRTYTCSISYIIFSDLQALLMFHFLIISKTQSSSIYVFLVATTYSGFNLLSYLPISYKVNVHLHHNIIWQTQLWNCHKKK